MSALTYDATTAVTTIAQLDETVSEVLGAIESITYEEADISYIMRAIHELREVVPNVADALARSMWRHLDGLSKTPAVTLAQLDDTVSEVLGAIQTITRDTPDSSGVMRAIDELRPLSPRLADALTSCLCRHLERLTFGLPRGVR